MSKEDLENTIRKRKIAKIEEHLKDSSIDSKLPVSMIALKDEYLKVKDNDGVYSEAIKSLFIDGFYDFLIESFSEIKEEIFKVDDFLLEIDICSESPAFIGEFGSFVSIIIGEDEDYKAMMEILQE